MNLAKHPTLIARQLQARTRELQPRGPVLAASLVTIHKKCGRPGCHCQQGPGHPGHYLTCKQEGKTRTVYVPLDLLPQVEAWIAEHRRLKALHQQISQLALAQVQSHVRAKRLKAGRP